MKLRSQSTLFGFCALSLVAWAYGDQSTDQLVQSSKAFCLALGWEFDDSKVQVKQLDPAPENRWRVRDGGISLILNENPIYVRIATNSRLWELRRWTSPDPSKPKFSGETAWVQHAKSIIHKVVPNTVLSKVRFEEVLLQDGPTPMQRSNANTAIVSLRITSPQARAGDEVTLILDRANGNVLQYAYWKKRT